VDIAVAWDDAAGRGDWLCTPGDLAIDPGGLRSAVLLSLFTDAAAPLNYVPPAGSTAERRGCWTDTYEPYSIGSWLWLLNRTKITDRAVLLATVQDYCAAALKWLQDLGVVDAVTVSALWLSGTVIGLGVTLTQPQSPPQVFQFAWAWQGA
jgi:phage gp46-like protein